MYIGENAEGALEQNDVRAAFDLAAQLLESTLRSEGIHMSDNVDRVSRLVVAFKGSKGA